MTQLKGLDESKRTASNMSTFGSLGRFSDYQSEDAFCGQVWPRQDGSDQQGPLIRHYQRCCNSADRCDEPVAKQSNSDVLAAVDGISANRTPTEILDQLTTRIHASHLNTTCALQDERIAEHLLVIAFMVKCMCNAVVGHVRPTSTSSNIRHLQWTQETPKEVLKKAFPKTNNVDGKGRLPRTFHARNLERLGSIKVVWTNNLLDHLRLHDPAEEGRPYTVTVFHHAQFLESHETSDLFPPGFITETQRTLALLFPGYVGGTAGWFKKLQKNNKDLDIGTCFCTFSDSENRMIQSFAYWRDRIAILQQTYDESEPKTIWQWWNDGRKRERWATFWVAIIVLVLTIFFGVAQTLEGALQVYKAYHPS